MQRSSCRSACFRYSYSPFRSLFITLPFYDMNETTLNALINLFALFSSITESRREEATETFSLYLHQHLAISASHDYMELFEELLDFYGVGGEALIPIDKEQQARKISENIQNMLRKEEQIMVFLRFLELAKRGNVEKAKTLFDTLSDVFGIPQEEYRKFLQFIFHASGDELSSSDFVLYNNKTEFPSEQPLKHHYEKHLDGELLFLFSPLIGHFIFILHGKDELTLGENPIQPERFYAFKEGGIIRGPRIAPIYYIDVNARFGGEDRIAPFLFSAEEIEFRFKNSENGLHTFSFSEPSGQLIAIMGGSGVGKSTLINVLNGNIPVQKGTIRINQYDIYRDKKEIDGLIGYVPQDDLLFEELTVRENLYYNACLCFDELSDSEIQAKVDRVLQELELYPFKDLKVGSPLNKTISGGQRKRLNVAMELIREPAILFVDEPTSGLSSTDSEMVMLLLKEQARKGKLILVNIHQPSSAIYKLFDKLWVMDKGGRPIYTGNPLDAVIYFKRAVDHVNAEVSECVSCGNVNPEQVLEIIETKKIDSSGNFTTERRFSPDYWFNLYRELTVSKRSEQKEIPAQLPVNEMKKPGLWKQFLIFFARNLRTKLADHQYLLINLLEAPVLALIVAYFTRYSEGDEYLFFENKNIISYIFMSIVVVIFMGMSISAEEIIKDRKILQREAFLSLSRFSYLNSKILFLLILSAFQSLCFVLIGNLIIGIEHFIPAYWAVLFSVAFFSNLLGLNISSALDSVVTIYILIPLLLIPQILLCGVIVEFNDLQSHKQQRDAVPVIGDLMVSRWAFEAIAVEQYQHSPYMAYFFDIEREIARERYRSDLLIPELMEQMEVASLWKSQGRDKKEVMEKLSLLRKELTKLADENDYTPYPDMDKLVIDRFSPIVAYESKPYMEELKAYFRQRFQAKQKERDRLITQLNKTYGNEYVYDLKMHYHNASLERLVLNSTTQHPYRIVGDVVMQKVAPIYKTADYSNGRAHFLAAEKCFFGHTIPTYTFNLLFIWLMSLVLYVALYYDWLRKAIHLFQRIKRRR